MGANRHQKNLKEKKKKKKEPERERAAHRQRDEKLLASLQRRNEFAVIQRRIAMEMKGNLNLQADLDPALIVLQRCAGCSSAHFTRLI
ncbi:hypothetical protein llap_8976 [Limosa lapponica baueri]|uniref:Uncharacterized protein n=1 Tax=Limosa lapponica baueri TaxID=1758121 RepID=A0A2I0U421_LIMLA|nr:hypothetical protein llap_8976 [Limosa lapponica baueri]